MAPTIIYQQTHPGIQLFDFYFGIVYNTIMMVGVVIDTNVLYSGLRSRSGYSFRLLEQIPLNLFSVNISVPLIVEYESILTRYSSDLGLSISDIRDFVDYFCKIGKETKIYYLWRPLLKDPYDDHILEVAVASQSRFIITHNKKDFAPADKFEITVCTPKEFMERR